MSALLLSLLCLIACASAGISQSVTTLLVSDRLGGKKLPQQGAVTTSITTSFELDLKHSEPGSQAWMVYNSMHGALAVGLVLQRNGTLGLRCEQRVGDLSATVGSSSIQTGMARGDGVDVKFTISRQSPSGDFRVLALVRRPGIKFYEPLCHIRLKEIPLWSLQAQLTSNRQSARLSFTQPIYRRHRLLALPQPLKMEPIWIDKKSPLLKLSAGYRKTISRYEIVRSWAGVDKE